MELDYNFIKENSYNGNGKLKKAGVRLPITEEEKAEYFRCKNDFFYFLENYCKIISLDEGLVNFKLYPYQRQMMQMMDTNRFNIFLLPRQMGKTITVAAYLCWAAIFNKRYTIAILANKADQAREIMSRLQLMYEELPWYMQPGVKTWNKGDIWLGNGSKVFTAATTGSSVRGKSLNMVYLDEFAFVENDVEFYTSTYPVITSGKKTKVIITSTPNGMNLFYKLWTDAVELRSEYKHLQVHWSEHPNRDEKWKNDQMRNMDEKQFNQEFGCEFLGSTDTLISGNKLQQLTYKEPIGGDQHFKIYEEADKEKSYVITADVSEGIGKDYSIISVFDVSTAPYKQVAIYRSNIIPPLMLSEAVYRIANMYNEAVVIVESNNMGSDVCNSLWNDYEYENMLITRNKNNESQIREGRMSSVGIRTTSKTKLIGCSSLKALIESNTLLTVDFETYKELTTFIKKGKSYEAEKGKYDDIVMSLVLFAWFVHQPYFSEMVDLNVRALTKDNLYDEYSSCMGFFTDGTEQDNDSLIW
jgi:hypothetical protein